MATPDPVVAAAKNAEPPPNPKVVARRPPARRCSTVSFARRLQIWTVGAAKEETMPRRRHPGRPRGLPGDLLRRRRRGDRMCLVNRGQGTPFISGLDLRPLTWTMYPEATVNQSLLLLSLSRPSATFGFNRYQFWPAGYPMFRYPYDPFDRLWQRYSTIAGWTNITTSAAVEVSNISSFDKPTNILRSTATPVNTTRIDFTWSPDSFVKNDNATYLLLLYFAELQILPSNASRQFDILVDNATWNGSQGFTPKYLSAEVVKRMVQGPGQHTISLAATSKATLPPILNALEIYSVKSMTEVATNDVDARAMITIRAKYALKINWMGDPCAPKALLGMA